MCACIMLMNVCLSFKVQTIVESAHKPRSETILEISEENEDDDDDNDNDDKVDGESEKETLVKIESGSKVEAGDASSAGPTKETSFTSKSSNDKP